MSDPISMLLTQFITLSADTPVAKSNKMQDIMETRYAV